MNHPTQPPLGATPEPSEPTLAEAIFDLNAAALTAEHYGVDAHDVPPESIRVVLDELSTARAALAQCEERLAEMTARAMSLVLHLPPETLAGDVQRWRDDVKAELAKLAQCEEKLAKQERDILWVETRISCDDSGAEVLRQREQIEQLTAAHAKALEDGKRLEAAMKLMTTYQHLSPSYCMIPARLVDEFLESAASAPATTGKGGEIS